MNEMENIKSNLKIIIRNMDDKKRKENNVLFCVFIKTYVYRF